MSPLAKNSLEVSSDLFLYPKTSMIAYFLCYLIEIGGKYTRIHMCGMPKETASFEDACQQKIFQSKDGQQLDGTFCECGSDGCNESSKIVPLDKVFFLLICLMYIIKLILSKTITSNI